MHCPGSDYAAPMPPIVRKTPQHTVAIDDELWQTARSIAKVRRETLSEVLRQSLARYVQRHKHLVEDDA